MPSALVVVGSAFAVLLAVAGASVPYRQQRRLWRFETTTGRVVASAVEPRTSAAWYASGDDSSRVTDAVVEYEYRADAREHTNDIIWPAGVEPTRRRFQHPDTDFAASVVERFPEGEPVTVYYDPEDPSDAFLVPARNWVIPVVCLLFVVALAVWAGHCTGVVPVPVGELDCRI